MGQKVAILGASDKPERYSLMAFRMLREYGHTALPVSPNLKSLEGVPVVARLSDLKGPVDTLTVYVNPEISDSLSGEILALKPSRVIFTPGSENPSLAAKLSKAGVYVLDACTMVLLRTGQFETA